MNSLKHIGTLVGITLILSSCYSSRELIDDDVYVIKNSILSTDESLTDETNYSNYRYEKNQGRVTDSYYSDGNTYFITNNYYPGSWGYGNPYFSTCYSPFYDYDRSLYYGNGFYNAFGDVVYDPFSGSYFINPSYNMYCYNGSSYFPYYYGYGGYYNYGLNAYGYPYYYGNGFYGNNYPTSGQTQTVHSGPRSSLSGMIDPSRRGSTSNQQKMVGTTDQKVTKSELKPESRVVNSQNASQTKLRNESVSQVRTDKPTVHLKPTEIRPSSNVNNNYRMDARPNERPIMNNPSRGVNEPRINHEPTKVNNQGSKPERGGNSTKPPVRRN